MKSWGFQGLGGWMEPCAAPVTGSPNYPLLPPFSEPLAAATTGLPEPARTGSISPVSSCATQLTKIINKLLFLKD